MCTPQQQSADEGGTRRRLLSIRCRNASSLSWRGPCTRMGRAQWLAKSFGPDVRVQKGGEHRVERVRVEQACRER